MRHQRSSLSPRLMASPLEALAGLLASPEQLGFPAVSDTLFKSVSETRSFPLSLSQLGCLSTHPHFVLLLRREIRGFSKARVLPPLNEQFFEIDCGNASSRVEGHEMNEIR